MFFKKQSWAVLLSGLVLGAPTVWAADNQGDRDDRLEDRVETRLKADDKLDHISVDVDKGVLTMSGEVASRTERARAERLARAEGARRLVNKIEVDSDKAAAAIDQRAKERKEQVEVRADKEKDRIEKEAEAAKDRVERGLPATTATPARRVDRPTDRPTDDRPNDAERAVRSAEDAWITTKVKTKFMADDALDKADLHVDTDNKGVTTLTGTVPSETARSRAVEVARKTDGVNKVVDKIVVGAPVVR